MWNDVSAKYRVIIRFKEKYPIQKMCELFKVSRSGFYKWKKRASQPQQRSELDQFIIECQAQVKQSYGYRRVWLWMKRNKPIEWSSINCTAPHEKAGSSGADQAQTSVYAV